MLTKWEDLFEANQNVTKNKQLMSQYFDLANKPTISSLKAIQQKTKKVINNIAEASTDLITEEEVKILLVLMEHKACELLLNDDAPEYFKAIGEKVCDQVDSLSFTEKSQTLKKYKTPALEDINKQRLRVQEKILKKWNKVVPD